MIPLNWFLFVASALFCIGLFGVLTRRTAIGMLLGLEIMLNAVNINLLAFWHNGLTHRMAGAVFVVVIFTVAAAEVAVGLAIIISLFRSRRTVIVADIHELKD